MAIHGNKFALLRGDDGVDVADLISRFAAPAIKEEKKPSVVEKRKGNAKKPVKAEEKPSVVEKRNGNTKKPLVSSRLSSQFSSKLQRSYDHERGRDQGHDNRKGHDRNNRNGVERKNNGGGSSLNQNNGYKRDERPIERQNHREGRSLNQNNGCRRDERHVERQNNGGGISLNQNNGYRHDERPVDSSKQYEEQHNGDQKKELTDGWQVIRRHNVLKQNNTTGDGNVGRRERNNGWRREFKVDSGSLSEVKVFKDKQLEERQEQDGVSGGAVEKSTEANANKDEKEYRIRNRNSGGNDGVNRGYGQGGAGEGKDEGERRGNTGSYHGYRNASAAEGKGNAGSKGDNAAAAAEASTEPEFKKWKRDDRMTLKEYEKKLEKKRKVLESMKTQEQRVVTLDRDFESMHIVDKKNEETIFVKLNSDGDKLKKKVTMDKSDNNVHKNSSDSDKRKKKAAMDKNGNNAHKPLITNFKPAGTNYSWRQGKGYTELEEKANGGSSGGREGTGNNPDSSTSVKEAASTAPSFEDDKQFPKLAPIVFGTFSP